MNKKKRAAALVAAAALSLGLVAAQPAWATVTKVKLHNGCTARVYEPHISDEQKIVRHIETVSYHVYLKCPAAHPKHITMTGDIYRCHFKPHGAPYWWPLYGCKHMVRQTESGTITNKGKGWNVPFGDPKVQGKGWFAGYTTFEQGYFTSNNHVTMISTKVLNARPDYRP